VCGQVRQEREYARDGHQPLENRAGTERDDVLKVGEHHASIATIFMSRIVSRITARASSPTLPSGSAGPADWRIGVNKLPSVTGGQRTTREVLILPCSPSSLLMRSPLGHRSFRQKGAASDQMTAPMPAQKICCSCSTSISSEESLIHGKSCVVAHATLSRSREYIRSRLSTNFTKQLIINI
jgi:hypothetical protein